MLRQAGGGPVVTGGSVGLPILQGDFIANDPLASNTLLQDAPSGEWTVTTRLDTTQIDANGEQAGLVIWKSENPNTFSKLVAIQSGAGNHQFEHIVTQNGGVSPPIPQSITPAPGGQLPDQVLLRARYDGTNVIGEFSADNGATWTLIGQEGHAAPLAAPLRVGLAAFRGSNGGGTASFDWFRVHEGSEAGGPFECAATCVTRSDSFDGALNTDALELPPPDDAGDRRARAADRGRQPRLPARPGRDRPGRDRPDRLPRPAAPRGRLHRRGEDQRARPRRGRQPRRTTRTRRSASGCSRPTTTGSASTTRATATTAARTRGRTSRSRARRAGGGPSGRASARLPERRTCRPTGCGSPVPATRSPRRTASTARSCTDLQVNLNVAEIFAPADGPVYIGPLGMNGQITATYEYIRFTPDVDCPGQCNPLSDQFDGTELDPKWELVNPVAGAEPTVGDGHLTLPVIPGDLFGGNGIGPDAAAAGAR